MKPPDGSFVLLPWEAWIKTSLTLTQLGAPYSLYSGCKISYFKPWNYVQHTDIMEEFLALLHKTTVNGKGAKSHIFKI